MRGCPPCELEIGPSRIWRAALCAVALAAGAVSAGWVWSASPGASAAVLVVVAAVVLLVLVSAVSLLRRVRGVLRFSGATWHWTPHGAAAPFGESVAGRLEVHLDVASFMLLRFVPEATGRRAPRARWLPVDARNAGGGWHAFRCAAYAPRPTAASLGVVSDGSS